MTYWLKTDLPEVHAFDLSDPDPEPNDPSGYRAVCGALASRRVAFNSVGQRKAQEFLSLPTCRICAEKRRPLSSEELRLIHS